MREMGEKASSKVMPYAGKAKNIVIRVKQHFFSFYIAHRLAAQTKPNMTESRNVFTQTQIW